MKAGKHKTASACLDGNTSSTADDVDLSSQGSSPSKGNFMD